MPNPIQYTSRTYNTILNDINNDPDLVDKPLWVKKGWAGIGDILSLWENASSNQAFLRTAFTRQAVMDLCALIDYDLSSRETSSGILLFYIKGSAGFPFIVAKKDLIGQTIGSVSVSSKKFGARSDESVAAVNEAFTVNTGNDQLTVAREYTTGEKVRVTTTNALPAPLAVSTDYYVIKVDATHIRLATTLANSYAGTYIDITTVGVGVHTIHLYSLQVTCYQQESLSSPVSIGTSDGVTEWQEFDLLHNWVLKDTITIEINGQTWTRVDTLVNSTSTDRHFKLLYKKDGASYVMFGNGTYGAIPGAFEITADYSYGGGADSNVSIVNKISVYAGSDANLEGVSNPSTFTGGADEETLDTAKRLAPLLLKARDRFVTTEDGESLSEKYGGVSIVNVIKNAYGLLSCKIVIVPTGGGAPSASLKSELDTYLTERTVLESIDVRIEDPTYNTRNVTSAAKMQSGYVFADVLPFYRLCVRLLLSEYTLELIEDYLNNGIASSVSLINAKWGDTFTSDDYSKVQVLLDELYNRLELVPHFGQRNDETETLGFINMFVDGIDYLTWTAPAFPITNADDEINTDGTMNLTEIP